MKLDTSTISKTCPACKHINVTTMDVLPIINIGVDVNGDLKIDMFEVKLNCSECGHSLVKREEFMSQVVQRKISELLPTIWK